MVVDIEDKESLTWPRHFARQLRRQEEYVAQTILRTDGVKKAVSTRTSPAWAVGDLKTVVSCDRQAPNEAV
jgi:hypothetical protein